VSLQQTFTVIKVGRTVVSESHTLSKNWIKAVKTGFFWPQCFKVDITAFTAYRCKNVNLYKFYFFHWTADALASSQAC